MESDEALTELISDKPELPISELRTLIRNARREKEQNKPPKAFRELFQLLQQHH